jgi:hypothetical protein
MGSGEWQSPFGAGVGNREWQSPMDATHALIPYSLLTTPHSLFFYRNGSLKFNGSFQDILNQIMAIFWQI